MSSTIFSKPQSTEISSLNSKLATENFNVTPASGITLYGQRCRKSGNVINIYIEILTGTQIPTDGTTTTIATIPSGYTPVSRHIISANIDNGAGSYAGTCEAYVGDAGGTIKISTKTVGFISIDATYII